MWSRYLNQFRQNLFVQRITQGWVSKSEFRYMLSKFRYQGASVSEQTVVLISELVCVKFVWIVNHQRVLCLRTIWIPRPQCIQVSLAICGRFTFMNVLRRGLQYNISNIRTLVFTTIQCEQSKSALLKEIINQSHLIYLLYKSLREDQPDQCSWVRLLRYSWQFLLERLCSFYHRVRRFLLSHRCDLHDLERKLRPRPR